MSTVTGYTAVRMQEIEDSAIVDGDVVGDNLILTRHDGTTIDAGNVRGPIGPAGPPGARCKVNRATSQAIPGTGAATPIVWSNEEYDSDGTWAPGTPDSLIVPASNGGLWRFNLLAQWAAGGAGAYSFFITLNGNVIAANNSVGVATWMIGGSLCVETMVAAGDIIKAVAQQTSGANVNVTSVYPISFSAFKQF